MEFTPTDPACGAIVHAWEGVRGRACRISPQTSIGKLGRSVLSRKLHSVPAHVQDASADKRRVPCIVLLAQALGLLAATARAVVDSVRLRVVVVELPGREDQ